MVGSVAFSTLSDHFGRKISVFLSIFVLVSIIYKTAVTKAFVYAGSIESSKADVVGSSVKESYIKNYRF